MGVGQMNNILAGFGAVWVGASFSIGHYLISVIKSSQSWCQTLAKKQFWVIINNLSVFVLIKYSRYKFV